ncbi:MAG TPA: NAD-dependent epimerase/dehydratase family protein [Anaerolineae bacterium]|nr:NAD-dependent epimerase/dehydratase family protein [Anaerolineae bacterium]HQH37086.1 NAD-dependent epimerase/dehydratase family protein [Anaerolineae bacterium]
MTIRALVTGATGCVGANIVEALSARGYAVRALRRATSTLDALAGLDPEYVVGDVLDEASLCAAMADCELVFHAAAVSQYWRNKPDAIYTANVEGTRHVLRAAMAQGVQRVVFTSSVAALGVPTQRGQRLDESAVFNLRPAQFHYGYSKVLAEAEVRRAVAEGLDVVIVNPVSVIGQRDVHFVGGEILRTAKQGLLIGAPPGGMGIVSAKAAGEGHVLAAERGRTGERYILNDENISHRALMTLAAQVTGARAPWFTIPRVLITPLATVVDLWNRIRRAPPLVDGSQLHLSVRDMYFDGSKAERELGFVPGSAQAAVVEAWEWYREHGFL